MLCAKYRQIKYIIAQAQGVIPHPLPEVNFLMVEIPTPKPFIFMAKYQSSGIAGSQEEDF
jgi:hypothetical protein